MAESSGQAFALDRFCCVTTKSANSPEGGAEYGALIAWQPSIDPDLAIVVDAWPDLPDAFKAGILALVREAR